MSRKKSAAAAPRCAVNNKFSPRNDSFPAPGDVLPTRLQVVHGKSGGGSMPQAAYWQPVDKQVPEVARPRHSQNL